MCQDTLAYCCTPCHHFEAAKSFGLFSNRLHACTHACIAQVSLLEAETAGFERPELVEEWAALEKAAAAGAAADGKAGAGGVRNEGMGMCAKTRNREEGKCGPAE